MWKNIYRLRVLATTCEFGPLVDNVIRDQFVFHCASIQIRERILGCKNPSHNEVLDMALSIERSAISTRAIQSNPLKVNLIADETGEEDLLSLGPRDRISKPNQSSSKFIQNKTQIYCYRCGSKSHIGNFQGCPASGKRCSNCGKMGHFQKLCRARKKPVTVRSVDSDTSECTESGRFVVNSGVY